MTARVNPSTQSNPMFSHPVADVAVSLGLGVWATKRTRIRAGGLSAGGK